MNIITIIVGLCLVGLLVWYMNILMKGDQN